MKKLLPIVLLAAVAASLIGAAGAGAGAFSPAEIAPPEACPSQTDPGLSAAQQAEVMLCMTNFARDTAGLAPLTLSRQLQHAAEGRSADIVNCDDFSHEACGRPFTFWDQRYGYLKGCWKAAENIAWGTEEDADVREIVTAWLESPEHHANILGPYHEVGIGLRVGGLEGYENAAVWTQDFGSHKC